MYKKNNRIITTSVDRYRFGDIIGKSAEMQSVYDLIFKASVLDTNVIVYGESGTGKELVAKAIRDLSCRHDKPFVVVNCGAIAETLFESEMFGYKKGAFSGADTNKKGFFDQAEGGTLFLDEIGDIPFNMQVKLLRVIEGGGFLPVGATQAKYPDVRIIFATNKNLEKSIKNGTMREDFYYRIHIFPINIPALRDRSEDIPLLIDFFLQKYCDGSIPLIESEIIEALKSYCWKGNVRELQNVILRYINEGNMHFMESKVPALKKNIMGYNNTAISDTRPLRTILAEVEMKLIRERLEKNGWNKTQTANSLQIDRKTLLSKIKNYEIVAAD